MKQRAPSPQPKGESLYPPATFTRYTPVPCTATSTLSAVTSLTFVWPEQEPRSKSLFLELHLHWFRLRMPAQQTLSPAASSVDGWKLLEVKGNNMEKNLLSVPETHTTKSFPPCRRGWGFGGAFLTPSKVSENIFWLFQWAQQRKEQCLKSPLTLNSSRPNLFRLLLLWVWGGLIWEEEADKSWVSKK